MSKVSVVLTTSFGFTGRFRSKVWART